MSNSWVKDNRDLINRVEQILKAAYDENAELHLALNGDSPLQIESLNPDREPYSIEKSEALFWAERDTYYEELDFCLLKHHESAIQYLKANDLVPTFHDLVDAIKRNRVVPFIGAGMSLPSGFPLWGKALRQILDRMEGIDIAAVTAEIDSFKYLNAAQLLWDHDSTQVKHYIRNKFAQRQIPREGVKGPITLLDKISSGCLITTNFDSAIETVIGRGHLEGYMHGLQQGNKFVPRLIKGDRCILKLHGDAEDHETYIFTQEQYTNGYGDPFDFSKPLPKALRQIFVGQSLLFLGCSLEQDKTLELFADVLRESKFEVPDHFAILPEPNGGETKGHKENRLIELKIRPIWYPGDDHEFVERYLKLAIDISGGRLEHF
ncbi:SIR2 family protein [Geobacter sp. SVR]|uniref:SIR2 family protein n=1 Tax=Geobacter sp. SVR TaxID=2495594 RepID=UPI00143EFEA2|nr:SIR2 family protein [Geobacter sp. SVR]BCS54580.1 hypothetical protein GSVR_28880 [Geobacter sp. SVR]GCF86913.1 hypothetical protein GSbR_35130 [Geobacter sp. SVR]